MTTDQKSELIDTLSGSTLDLFVQMYRMRIREDPVVIRHELSDKIRQCIRCRRRRDSACRIRKLPSFNSISH